MAIFIVPTLRRLSLYTSLYKLAIPASMPDDGTFNHTWQSSIDHPAMPVKLVVYILLNINAGYEKRFKQIAYGHPGANL